uniref:Sulfotransferase family protein n=1 Tax=Candidatus Kentrum sp. FW TaxID=2126338 RepID=A0A450S825_9GAMM|nr:MAG: Sulfotransferase family protein [Candidatus Kentron sp. FW]VFJ51780.1 MAG: Sulfotransferase family protein [Candidatus Kentron sp. FW]
MFISHKYRVIFVHIQRTGGYSIHDVFRRYDPELIESVPIDPARKRVRHCHIGDIRAAMDAELFNSYRKFCVVRHPYARMQSWYWVLKKGYGKNEPRMKADKFHLKVYQQGIHYLNRHPNPFKARLAGHWTRFFRALSGAGNNSSTGLTLRGENIGNQVLSEINRHARSFHDFLNLPRERADGLFERFYTSQFDYISEQGEVLIDDVLRFEQLDRDFTAFAEKIDFPGRLPHLNKSAAPPGNRNNPDEAGKEIIRKRFEKDFIYFGYRE